MSVAYFPSSACVPRSARLTSTTMGVFTLSATLSQLTLTTGSQLDPELRLSTTTCHNCGVVGQPQEVLQTRNSVFTLERKVGQISFEKCNQKCHFSTSFGFHFCSWCSGAPTGEKLKTGGFQNGVACDMRVSCPHAFVPIPFSFSLQHH